VLACASELRSDGSLTVALRCVRLRKDPVLPRARDPHHGDLARGSFQTIQGRVASSTEGGATGETSKCLDPFSTAMGAIPHQGVHSSVSDAKVRALLVRAGEPSVFTRVDAPRRLLTSRQGRTGAGAGPPADEAGAARRRVGQSSGVRGLRRRWSVVRLAPPEEEGQRWIQSRCQSSARESRRQTTNM
jgi:hypothetical protein